MPVRLSRTTPIHLTRGGCLAAFAVLLSIALCWSGSSTVPAIADDCVQPSDDGCPIDLNQQVTEVFSNASDGHTWRLTVSRAVPLHIVLTNLPVDYDLHLYAGDGSFLRESTNEGTQDDVADLPDAEAGTYRIYVNSPRGDVSDQPYTLVVSDANGVATVAQPPASPTQAAPTPTANPSTRAAPGTVLLADNFTDEQNGWLPSGPVVNGFVRYLDAEYQITRTSAGNLWPGVYIPGTFADSSVALDARFINPTPTPNVALSIGCRAAGSHGYFARIQPELRVAALVRYEGDPNTFTNLVPDTLKAFFNEIRRCTSS
jgi:hypothetical protein